MLPPNKNRLGERKGQNKTCADILTKLQTPKRFNRKRDKSSDSLSRSRVQNQDNTPVRDNRLYSTNPQNKQQKTEQIQQGIKISDILRSSGYIKSGNDLSGIAQSFFKNQKTANKLRISRKTQNFQNQRLCQIKEAYAPNQQEIKLQPLQIPIKKYQKRLSLDESLTDRSKQESSKNSRKQYTIQIHYPIDYELEYQIKCNQLITIQTENKKLKEIDQINKQQMKEKDRIISQLKMENIKTEGCLNQLVTQIKCLIQLYEVPSNNQVQVEQNKNKDEEQQNKVASLPKKLSECFEKYYKFSVSKYQEMLQEFRQRIHRENMSKNQYQITAGFVDRFKNQNQELKDTHKKLNQQISKMKKRNDALNEEINSLRVTNSKIRKTLTDLKKQIISKDISIKDLQIQVKQAKDAAQLLEIIQKEQREQMEIAKKCQKKEALKSESSVGTIEPNQSIPGESQNENNMSLNISDVSTEELMDIEDMLI